MKKRVENSVIWLTGASSGIGNSLALDLAARGNIVYASGRNAEVLLEMEAGNDGIRSLPVDVEDIGSVRRGGDRIADEVGHLDVAILNAGTCEYVDAANVDSELVDRVMNINFNGLVRCVEVALPLLRKSVSNPYLVGMSSTVAFAALPRAEAYGASKAAIKYFLDSLRIDLAEEGIDVSVICPGFVKTPLTDKNDFPMPMRISVEESTRQIVSGMERRVEEINYPKLFSYGLKLLGVLPRWLRNQITASMKRPAHTGVNA